MTTRSRFGPMSPVDRDADRLAADLTFAAQDDERPRVRPRTTRERLRRLVDLMTRPGPVARSSRIQPADCPRRSTRPA